jgi:hypothetical protein
MSQPIITVICYLLYFGLTIGIILLDARIQRQRAAAQGSVDFMDRKPTNYLVLAIFCGPLPLIAYFGITRKSAVGWLMGIGAAIAVYAAVFMMAFVLSLTVAVADHAMH